MNPLEKPLVSVILPSFNRKNIVDRAITSVISQTYPHWELHIVDDGSTDETWNDLLSKLTGWKGKLSSFGRNQKSIQVHQIEHKGVSGARNFGMEKANGDWIAFLDSDDEWYPEKLSKQMDFHKSNPEFFFSQTKEVWNKKGNLMEPKGKYQKRSGWFLKESLELCMVTSSSFMAHKPTLAEIGGFRTELLVCEDYDLWNRILFAGFPIGLIEENLMVRYGGHEDQLSNQYQALERFRLYSLLLTKEELSENGKWDLLEPAHKYLFQIAIKSRMDTILQGRFKRGKDAKWIERLITDFLSENPISKVERSALLDDSLF
ncbi:glycosyltransferase family 2 protein [Leptospira sp. 2 VSF19]|uniref:Glycosyltransferase family 2 protein n=1 Tax=Leptospira soteropolitanensis TaxID=2950025 RepID=A0AAW5VN63_9LEPT|nr:glycosyltransferase family A protein [Leptospira soteropolitanensis]MCW7492185.1 glycosyltransferase family 2 protein [Leptospira soteropolitanensis]MCW7499767.1 glycosyltransferase family 2 protein [Leptospira soteropolitanensis]MCW7522018.1 glycosyltransferase family 2 protein [Leptospira soteropolitanensis]MCW7525872.1 glycosyltransferase family 2 protein [Leptospira soteropolitanensis]MCW7530014.1 glycosyltransferase family 2 protein [Leptospira soteropolitanensis]